ncbi:MAG: VWA domain-containing protein [Armatimonadota bacterium]|nr:VWA domain-containing protein [Armatimonadota bacterium]MDR7450976.1 VWA domain-containing protein [Armatimonadota bacterium]MDR7466003.1 VWA domain-containing protein [Armatimonadota bacterium]MDR7494068.1 VWA domain-containing protein [Armatimonadota bacterium]MDR7504065.1 VWA domain-containing protein [Armatimonadota bacterium]
MRIARAVVALDAAGVRPVYAVPATAPAVYAVWKVAEVSARSEVQVKWIALKVEGVAPGTVMSTSSAAVDRDTEGAASLVRPAGGWKAGRYRVEITARSGATRGAEFVVTAIGAVHPGLVIRLFADHTYNSMRKTGLAQTFALEWNTPPVTPLIENKFWIEWEGLLTPPTSGRYEFLFLGDGVSFLYIDGRLILPHPMQAPADERTLTLDSSPHTIRLGTVEEVPRGRLSLLWKGPGDRDHVPIDPRYLSHAAAQRHWRRTSRQAAQAGLEWLQSQSVSWQRTHKCFGCHVQGQVIMGLAEARANDYIINEDAYQQLIQLTRERQNPDGSYHNDGQVTATQFAAVGLTAVDQFASVREDATLLKALRWLLPRQQPAGEITIDNVRPPINQGSILTTANSAAAFARAAAETGDPQFRRAADCAVAWIADAATQTTQDKAFKIMALSRLGNPEQRRAAAALAQELVTEQAADGGWKEAGTQSGSNAFATGQALCALRDAGGDIGSPPLQKAVRFLLAHQKPIGAWPRMNTAGESDFAHTMWAAICLAGGPEQITAALTGRIQVTSALRRVGPVRRNLEIVLDVSGSMNARLGTSTRWQTALTVLRSVVARLPDDFNVGLRVYGHRLPSTSPQTCRDSELMVPISRLDRTRFLSALTSLRPRGETPLVYSALQAAADLRPLGGGFIVLITDGEESCRGDPAKAAAQMKAAGLDVTLNIVGFTLKGQQAERQLATFAGATGGRYYSAPSGAALARALRLATTDRFPYKIFDTAGRVVAQGEAGDLGDELPPGRYKVVVQAADDTLTANVTVVADQTAVFAISLRGDRFVLMPR